MEGHKRLSRLFSGNLRAMFIAAELYAERSYFEVFHFSFFVVFLSAFFLVLQIAQQSWKNQILWITSSPQYISFFGKVFEEKLLDYLNYCVACVNF